MRNWGKLVFLAALALAAGALGTPGARAAGAACSTFLLNCEDGRTYPFCPVAVTEGGDIATGYLVLSRQHGTHMRLVPMGVGYRYIGPGVWFDGVRDQATLFLDKDRGLACTVVRE
jgi:hypothetical protein